MIAHRRGRIIEIDETRVTRPIRLAPRKAISASSRVLAALFPTIGDGGTTIAPSKPTRA